MSNQSILNQSILNRSQHYLNFVKFCRNQGTHSVQWSGQSRANIQTSAS
jgi:hypothetical protein